MVQKENQQSNEITRNMPGRKKKSSNGVDKENLVADTNSSNNDVQCRQKGPGVSVNKTKGVGKRNKQKTEFDVVGKSGDINSDEFETSYNLGKIRNSSGVQFSAASFVAGWVNRTFSNMFGGCTVETMMNKCRSSEAVAGMRAAALYALRTATIWLEQLQPQLKSVAPVIRNGQNYVRAKVGHAYPIIMTKAVFFGKLVFLLSMVWLDCAIRGLDSLLRLGSTSFFTVIWCSIISVYAMIGFTKMLVIMVVVALLAVFVGLGLSIWAISISALIILWLYGSFWTTGFVVLLGGLSFVLGHERIALFVINLYSFYCARSYVGWLGLLLGFNLSFISSDLLLYLLKNNIIEPNSDEPPEQTTQTQGKTYCSFSESFHSLQGDDGFQFSFKNSVDRTGECSSTSGVEAELTSEGEVVRLLNCTDHYSALGFARYENIDITQLKKEYRKKAMLVHPDKNMGNEKAAEAFKKLQNAYEVLLDSLKRKTYDDELRREELLNYFRRFQSSTQKKGRQGFFRPGFSHSEAEYEGPYADSRKIACKKCNDFHIWGCTQRSKSQARWCQECQEFHQAKDGDGWVEQSFQPLLFGLLQKGNLPRMYVCAESRIYDVTDWFICQGMRCSANTHKPSFHVNASVMKQTNSKGSNSATRNGGATSSNIDETMTEEEFFEWLQNAVQSGMFDSTQSPKQGNDTQSPKTGGGSSNSKKKRKGKKQQW